MVRRPSPQSVAEIVVMEEEPCSTSGCTVHVRLDLNFVLPAKAGFRVSLSNAARQPDGGNFNASALRLRHAEAVRLVPVTPYLSWDMEVEFWGYDVEVQVGKPQLHSTPEAPRDAPDPSRVTSAATS